MITRKFYSLCICRMPLLALTLVGSLPTPVNAEEQKKYHPPVAQTDADGRVFKGRAKSIYWEPYMADADLSDYRHASPEAVERFRDLKYGLRIHWGIYSFIHGKESWVIPQTFKNEPDFLAWYHELHQAWYPDAFDADAWMKRAKQQGFTFFTITAKHHDGFSLYDTKIPIPYRIAPVGEKAGEVVPYGKFYSVMETPFKRDIIRELVDAGRANGLKIGLYYSNPDWFDADFRFRKPGADKSYTPESEPEAFERFKNRHAGQIKELLTNYGPIDILSLDLMMVPFTWEHMQATARMARELQPDVMIRWRGIGHYGDYQTPENVVPGEEDLGTMPWKVIHTLSKREIFSYEPDETQLRDGTWIIENLVDITAKGGNFMVGVGPNLRGNWHPKVMEALDDAGAWLETNGEAIFATRSLKTYREGDRLWFTRSKDARTIYVLHRGRPDQELFIRTLVGAKVDRASLLGSKVEVNHTIDGEALRLSSPQGLGEDAAISDPIFYVFKLDLKMPFEQIAP